MSAVAIAPPVDVGDVITVMINGQTFGIPVNLVQDVLSAQRMTRIPLSPRRVAGVMNLRGRIVTAISARTCLGLGPGDTPGMFVVVSHGDELYGLMVDQVGDAIPLDRSALLPNPPHMDAKWRELSLGIVRRNNGLVIILDIDRLIGHGDEGGA